MPPDTGRPGEFELIARHLAPLAAGFAGAFGLRDDAAVIAPSPGRQLVVTSDAIVAGVHFNADDPPALVARKALRVNLSDLAAKGAQPRFYLLDLLLPEGTTETYFADFCAGLRADQAAFAIHLAGGDTNSTPGPLAIAITAFGEIDDDRLVLRSGARPGDGIFVTGTIGDAALGLAALGGELADLGPGPAKALRGRYLLPQPRVGVGPRLVGIATAAIDISDGLVADLGHICEVSGCSALVEAPRVPLSAAAAEAVRHDPSRLDLVLAGGDDYEILFTAPPAAADRLQAIARASGVPITLVGQIIDAADTADRVRVLDSEGRPMRLAAGGWAHF